MISEVIFPKENSIPVSQLESLCRDWAAEKASGIVHTLANGQFGTVLFNEGIISFGYVVQPDQITQVNGTEYLASLAKTATTLKYLRMPVSGMTIARIMIEQEVTSSDTILRSDLVSHFGKLHNSQSPIAIELVGSQSGAWIALPGGSLPVRDAVVFISGKVVSEKDILTLINSLPEPVYKVNFYQSIETDAWIEYFLRYIFGFVAELLLSRYGELTGRIMVTSIVRDMNVNCASMNLNIAALGQSINDETLFPSPLSAAEHYKFLFNLIIHHIETVVGSGLIVMIARQISASLPDFFAEIIKRYDLLPDIFLSSSFSGRAHR